MRTPWTRELEMAHRQLRKRQLDRAGSPRKPDAVQLELLPLHASCYLSTRIQD